MSTIHGVLGGEQVESMAPSACAVVRRQFALNLSLSGMYNARSLDRCVVIGDSHMAQPRKIGMVT